MKIMWSLSEEPADCEGKHCFDVFTCSFQDVLKGLETALLLTLTPYKNLFFSKATMFYMGRIESFSEKDPVFCRNTLELFKLKPQFILYSHCFDMQKS